MIALRKHTDSDTRHTPKMQEAIQSRSARSVRGESLTEVLVAILISCLAILMMATVIAASFNVNETSRKAMDKYYKDNNRIANQISGDSDTASGKGTVTMTSSDGTSVNLENNPVNYYIDELNNEVVVSFVVEEQPGA